MRWLRGRRWGRLLRGRLEGGMHVFRMGIVNDGMAFGIAFCFGLWSRHTRAYRDEFVNDDVFFQWSTF